MKVAPAFFYESTVKEVALAIKGYDEYTEQIYNLMFIAAYNANGLIQGGRKFKPIEPFRNTDNKAKAVPTKEKKEEALAFIEKYKQLMN